MSTVNKSGSIKGSQIADLEVELSIFRNGSRVEVNGAWNFVEFLNGFSIIESITNSAIQASFVLTDSAGMSGVLTGSEQWKFLIKTDSIDRVYFFRTYEVVDRSRTNQLADIFIVNATSDEFLKNETVNVFGHSEVLFGGRKDVTKKTSYKQTESGTKAEAIVKRLLTNKDYIGSPKKVYTDQNESINNHQFVSTNWRPFDLIYWLGQRTIRKGKGKTTFQNGYAFYENAFGYHFKSIDGMIDRANDQKYNKRTDFSKAEPELYKYTYRPKSTGGVETDPFNINAIVFPNERSYLMGLRHGSWAGYSIGFDPTTLGNSKVGTDVSQDISNDTYRYSNQEIWKNMSHLGKTKDLNPIKLMDKGVQNLLDYPKRVRYTALPNQVFDKKFANNPQKNYEQLVELQAYQYLRLESLKSIQLSITVPGNLDLYAGAAVDVELPSGEQIGEETVVDRKYSGRYLIAGVEHESTGETFSTKLFLCKDSLFGIVNTDPANVAQNIK
tara:strand:- start:34 stop:1527 length:1494 start_codon:yes stop_codon:yes gene_type:complete